MASHQALVCYHSMVASHSAGALPVALTAAAVTSAARMYVGAHLPLDIVGGLCAGWMIGSVMAICVDR